MQYSRDPDPFVLRPCTAVCALKDFLEIETGAWKQYSLGFYARKLAYFKAKEVLKTMT